MCVIPTCKSLKLPLYLYLPTMLLDRLSNVNCTTRTVNKSGRPSLNYTWKWPQRGPYLHCIQSSDETAERISLVQKWLTDGTLCNNFPEPSNLRYQEGPLVNDLHFCLKWQQLIRHFLSSFTQGTTMCSFFKHYASLESKPWLSITKQLTTVHWLQAWLHTNISVHTFLMTIRSVHTGLQT